jgi:pilus assembly protein CpaF
MTNLPPASSGPNKPAVNLAAIKAAKSKIAAIHADTGASENVMKVGTGLHKAFEASMEFFLSPLMPYFRDPEVTEIMVNGHDCIYVERRGRIERTPSTFATEADLQAAANNMAQFVGQPLDVMRPLMDGRLPDGSRVCIVLGKLAATGTQINIRRFPKNAANPEFLIEKGAITPQAMEFLLLAVKAHQNIVVSGGSGSGKTTVVNVLTHAFGEAERIVVIEETRELQVQRPHVVQLEARQKDQYGRGEVTVRDLFVTALRMRPDRIVVGEVRRGEALDMIQAMTSGHHGSLTTLHASSTADTCYRLETMALMSDIGLPLVALRRQVSSALDLVVHTARLPSGRRLVSGISEIYFDAAKDNYIIEPIFELAGEGANRHLVWTGKRPKAVEEIIFEEYTELMQLTKPMLEAPARPKALIL